MTAPIPASALAVLQEWLPANDSPARPLMTLSTIDAAGRPDARSVLLSEWDRTAFWLHTDSRSRKAAQLDAVPWAALTLAWPELKRQLVVQGAVRRATVEQQERSYAARSRYLQLLAWLNDDDFAAAPEADRVAAWAAFDTAHPELQPPGTWVGFAVEPVRLTFWHGREDAASRRVEHSLVDGVWTEALLPG